MRNYLTRLRSDGWSVAVHNDYRQDGEPHTFWLLTRDGRAVKGEGRTDEEALGECCRVAALEVPDDPERCSVCTSGHHVYCGECGAVMAQWVAGSRPSPMDVLQAHVAEQTAADIDAVGTAREAQRCARVLAHAYDHDSAPPGWALALARTWDAHGRSHDDPATPTHCCVTRVSQKTCAYLADGTKVVVRRGDETVGPAWLEVMK